MVTAWVSANFFGCINRVKLG